MTDTKYTVDDLYKHLFETIADLRTNKIEVAKAEAIKNLCQTVVNTGKLECRYIDVAGGQGSGFMPDKTVAPGDRRRLGNWPR